MDRVRLLALPAVLVAALPIANPAAETPSDALEQHRWRKRIILIAAPAEEDPRRRRQEEEILPLRAELAERGVEVLLATPGHPARSRLPVAKDDFVVAVIGLDGGIKLTRRDLLTAADLRRELDSPALRRSELKAAERARQKGEPGAPTTADETRKRLDLVAPAAGGGWTVTPREEPGVSSRCWLFDLPLNSGPLRLFRQPAALWHLEGDAIEALVLPRQGPARTVLLGGRPGIGEVPFLHLAEGEILTVRLRAGGVTGWSLLCETSEGSETADGQRDALLARFPAQADWLRSPGSATGR